MEVVVVVGGAGWIEQRGRGEECSPIWLFELHSEEAAVLSYVGCGLHSVEKIYLNFCHNKIYTHTHTFQILKLVCLSINSCVSLNPQIVQIGIMKRNSLNGNAAI